ncbi:MAG: GspH/FimT family protein [Betaproteobacteria bacterium]
MFDSVNAMRRLRAPRIDGFTLVELMVVVAVLTVLAGLGAGNYRNVTAKTRVGGAATDLRLAIELTRSEALKRGQRVSLLPVGGDWAAGWQVVVDTNGNRRADVGEPLLLQSARLNPATRVSVNTTPGYLAFGASGTPQQYSGAFLAATLEFCDSGNAGGVVLARTGRPRMTAGSC